MSMINITPIRTYASRANAIKAVERLFDADTLRTLRWIVVADDEGRFYPIFIGEAPCHYGVHFHFCVVN